MVDEVATGVRPVVVAGLLVRLAVGAPHLLLQVVGVGRAAVGIHAVPALALGVAEHGVHAVDAVLNRRVGVRGVHAESRLFQQGDIGGAGVDGLPGVARGVGVDADLAGVAVFLTVEEPIALLQLTDHVRGVVPVHDLVDRVGQAQALDVDDGGHLPDVEVHAHEDRFAGLDRFLAGVQRAVVGGVNGPCREVDELAVQVGPDQLLGV